MKKTILLITLLFTSFSLSQVTLAQAFDKTTLVASQKVEKVNLNTASAEQLSDVLHGVGIKKAQLIVEYRNKHGKFKSINELNQVKGIGEATIKKNKNKISI